MQIFRCMENEKGRSNTPKTRILVRSSSISGVAFVKVNDMVSPGHNSTKSLKGKGPRVLRIRLSNVLEKLRKSLENKKNIIKNRQKLGSKRGSKQHDSKGIVM